MMRVYCKDVDGVMDTSQARQERVMNFKRDDLNESIEMNHKDAAAIDHLVRRVERAVRKWKSADRLRDLIADVDACETASDLGFALDDLACVIGGMKRIASRETMIKDLRAARDAAWRVALEK